MSSPFRSPKFKKLFQKWNDILKQDGFIDAEDFSLPDPPLKTWHSLKWESEAAGKRERDATHYYELATELLHNGFGFQDDLSLRVWELHCKGMSVRQIEKALYSQMIGYEKRTRMSVYRIIVLIQKSSGIKNG